MLRRLFFSVAFAAMPPLLLAATPATQVSGPGDDVTLTGLASSNGPEDAPGGGGGGDEGEEIPFGEAHIYFELNDTDGDLGIHSLIDGEPWKHLQIEDPSGQKKLTIMTRGTMRLQGLTELFFESGEPAFDELSPEEFFDRFEEGYWEISGTTIEGDELESESFLSHVMPAPPENIRVNGLAVPEDCEEGPVPAVAADMPIVVTWDPVEDSHPEIGDEGDVEVELYQLVVEGEEVAVSANLPPEVTTFTFARDLFAPGDEIKIEVLVREAAGNQTAVESCFEIAE